MKRKLLFTLVVLACCASCRSHREAATHVATSAAESVAVVTDSAERRLCVTIDSVVITDTLRRVVLAGVKARSHSSRATVAARHTHTAAADSLSTSSEVSVSRAPSGAPGWWWAATLAIMAFAAVRLTRR